MKDIINNLKKSDTWKIQLTIAINFVFSKDTDKELVMHSKSDNMEIMIYDKADEVIKEPFHSLLSRYQTSLEELMKHSDFIFDCVNLMHFKCHKIDLNCGGLRIDSLDLMKIKKVTINPINDDKCFQDGATVALDHEKIGKNL